MSTDHSRHLSSHYYNRKYQKEKSCVADPGCLSRILIFTHPKTATKERGEKNLLSYLFVEEKFLANFQRILELFMQKIIIKLSKIWF
jgi:hypothetical protein